MPHVVPPRKRVSLVGVRTAMFSLEADVPDPGDLRAIDIGDATVHAASGKPPRTPVRASLRTERVQRAVFGLPAEGQSFTGGAEVLGDYPTESAALKAVAQKLGIGSTETLRKWVRQGRIDSGERRGRPWRNPRSSRR
jgi:transposase